MTTDDTTTIFVVEDHEITRLGLSAALPSVSGIEIIGEAGDGVTAASEVCRMKPHVVLMDIGLPGIDGIEATRKIKESCPDIKVIMLTSYESDDAVLSALRAGADGYALKDTGMERLVLAIKTVLAGDIWLHPEIGKRVLQTYTASPPPSEKLAAIRDFGLTGREREVLTLCVDGLSNNEMARCMCVTLETVKTHMRHIMEKLVVRDRTQAAVKALKHGLA